MSEAKIAIGSFSSWLILRCISLFSLIVGLALILANLRQFSLQFFAMGAYFLLIGLAGAHDHIYGIADESGIHYRQYFASRFLRWEEIAMISWVHANLVYFHLRKKDRSHRILTVQSMRSRSWAELYSEEPDIVRWLSRVKPTGGDGIEIRNPGASARWLLGQHPGVAARILQLMLVLIVVIGILSMIYAHR